MIWPGFPVLTSTSTVSPTFTVREPPELVQVWLEVNVHVRVVPGVAKLSRIVSVMPVRMALAKHLIVL